ncbi:MAG: hypothetical protein DRO65_01790 [Candidatus Altiarchaeales archaeon]|nr:MAG: hypothetical protein DRO65_01790 [Candidatus Altiarchaeales archaeon]
MHGEAEEFEDFEDDSGQPYWLRKELVFTRSISVKVMPWMYDFLKYIAEYQGKTVSGLLRGLIGDTIRSHRHLADFQKWLRKKHNIEVSDI